MVRTGDEHLTVGERTSAVDLIKAVVDEQGARYRGFLMSFAEGFQQTELEIPKWIVFAVLSFPISQLENGIQLRELSRRIKDHHPRGDELNNGNITQALQSASSLQSKKGIQTHRD